MKRTETTAFVCPADELKEVARTVWNFDYFQRFLSQQPVFSLGSILTLAMLLSAEMAFSQTDPGVQSGNRGTGNALPSVLQNDNQGILDFFTDGLKRFQATESVSNSPNGTNGLGPRFNANQCSACHAQPAVGGTSAAVNPQFQFVSNGTAPGNTIPSFITADGPTLEVRFPFFFNRNGSVNTHSPNGGVEDVFTVTGRPDAGSCNLPQPNFSQALAANNIIFRIPTPTFGAGLIENLDDSTLLKNQLANNNNRLGVSGSFNYNGNDGTITRFGWKAQNKSLHIFAGEAYNVEMGISNELFPQERPSPGEDQHGTGLQANCLNLSGMGYPEDRSNPAATPNSAVLDDVSAFANFMRFLAPPAPGTVMLDEQQVPAGTIASGNALFKSIGCAACHNPTVGRTQVSNFTGSLSDAPVNAYSDIEIHHMGVGLADNVSQGAAGGDQFRTAPLWGLGQRIFLMHDGRATNLMNAIKAHASQGSEANFVEQQFFNLTPSQQQELLDFLRSL
jgi:CxxC motif-containing protein (DUF1111 family)